MYQQINIFSFIKEPSENKKIPPKTLFEQMFQKQKNPVMLCTNCLCQYCVNNAEEIWNKVKPEEVQESCFNCDECQIYSGDFQFQNQQKMECANFAISDYGVARNQKRIRLIKS